MEVGKKMEMDGCGFECHETTGAKFLESLGFSRFVCAIVSNHVNAKRYLSSTDPIY